MRMEISRQSRRRPPSGVISTNYAEACTDRARIITRAKQAAPWRAATSRRADLAPEENARSVRVNI